MGGQEHLVHPPGQRENGKEGSQGNLLVENEALKFECEVLRREKLRLSDYNRTLEARLTLAEGELDYLRTYLRAVKASYPWRAAQKVRGWLGRRW